MSWVALILLFLFLIKKRKERIVKIEEVIEEKSNANGELEQPVKKCLRMKLTIIIGAVEVVLLY